MSHRVRRALLFTGIAAALSAAVVWRLSSVTEAPPLTGGASLWDLPVDGLDGRPETLAAYRGQVALVVNVASECGLAYQYPGLEALYQRYRERGLVVLAFPSNDFWQEPLDNAGIRQVCHARGVTFPVFGRTHVRGRDAAPVYRFLARAGDTPLWNFGKYLVGRDGRPRAFFGSLVSPEDPDLSAAIERALAETGPLEARRD